MEAAMGRRVNGDLLAHCRARDCPIARQPVMLTCRPRGRRGCGSAYEVGRHRRIARLTSGRCLQLASQVA